MSWHRLAVFIDPQGVYTRYEKIAPNFFYSHRQKLQSLSFLLAGPEILRLVSRSVEWKNLDKRSKNKISLTQQGELWRQYSFYVGFDNERKDWIFGSRLTKDEVEDLISDLEKPITIVEKRHVCKKG